MQRTFVWWIVCLLWCAVIFLTSHTPGDESQLNSLHITLLINRLIEAAFGAGIIEINDAVIRKAAHFFEYMILGILLFKALFRSVSMRTLLWFPLLAGVCYAIGDEIHQSLIPGRRARASDVMIDSLGLAFGILLAMAPWRRQGFFASIRRGEIPGRT